MMGFLWQGVSMRRLFVLLLAALSGGCATVTRGTTNAIGFDSQPSQAEVRTSTGLGCVTPCSLTVKRNEEFIATFSKPGYQSQQVEVKTQVAGAGAAGVAGNILIGGVVGIGVDAITGAALEHTPNPVSVVLEPLKRGAPPAASRPRQSPADIRAPGSSAGGV
jgi:hypothetical protein